MARSRSFGGRATVVLPTIIPSVRWRRAAPTISSSSPSVRSGAILIRTGTTPAVARTWSTMLVCAVFVGANMKPEEAARTGAAGEPPQDGIGTFAVEAQPVDHA